MTAQMLKSIEETDGRPVARRRYVETLVFHIRSMKHRI
jgi:hypothetical protein